VINKLRNISKRGYTTPSQGIEMLEVRLIGTFVINCDGKPVTLSSRAAQSLFAYLILTAGTLHRREKLAGMFWPDAAEARARTYLRHELWLIRKSLSSKSKVDYLIADDIHISFNASAEYSLDTAGLNSVNGSTSIEELMNGLSLFQGELLPGFYDDWITPEREHLQAIYEKNISRLLDMLETEKRWLDILEWAEKWISLGQGPEAAYRYLMIAYDELGDRVKVTATYQRCAQALRELDLEPSEQTRALAFKRTPKLNIPIPLTSFIGREKELKEIATLFSESRLITLTSSGGVGKTRLAIQVVADVMERFPDGIWFLDLAPLSDPALVPGTLASLLKLHESGEFTAIDLLNNYFRSRTALIIFDNCEHLIEACAQLIHLLLTSCENLSILATSREALRVSGEVTYRVPSLEIPSLDIQSVIKTLAEIESIRLFAVRAAAASPGFVVNVQNALVVAQICQRLDGIPLAIELAAARIQLLMVEEIYKRLENRFQLLTSGARTALPRHQTLRAAVEWSYDLLSEDEKILFRRLAVFVGGWTLEAAEQVCPKAGDSLNIFELLSHLSDKSLINVNKTADESRYIMLETLREYASQQLVKSGESDNLRQQHASFFLRLAETAKPELHGPDQQTWFERLDREKDNSRVALNWLLENDIEAAAHLASGLFWLWHTYGYWKEGCKWYDRLLKSEIDIHRQKSLTTAMRAQMLSEAGWLAVNDMDTIQARSLSEQSLVLYRDLGDKRGMAMALNSLSWVAFYLNEYSRAKTLAEESLNLYREIDYISKFESELNLLGNIARAQGNFDQAAKYHREGLHWARVIGDKAAIAYSLMVSGYLAWFQGDLEQAAILSEESLQLSRDVRLEWTIAETLNTLGDVARVKGEFEKASRLFDESNAIWEQLGRPREMASLFYSRGLLARVQSDLVEAGKFIKEGLKMWREAGDKRHMAECIEGLAGVGADLGKAELSARLMAIAELLREETNSPLTPIDYENYRRDISAIRSQLGESDFAKAWMEGRMLTVEQAVAYALKDG
jgi:predicted ATPase/DNA-binding SARP family transcriptional activator/tetratricopeptide (TPR) repeat protein